MSGIDKSEIKLTRYRNDDLSIDFYPNLLSQEVADAMYLSLEKMFPPTLGRKSLIFGDPELIYNVRYGKSGFELSRETIDWSTVPGLDQIRQIVDLTIGDGTISNVCILQRYADGKAGIKPHRDREMGFGTRICGVSLGATRTLQILRYGYDPFDIELTHGSLYVLNDPTNQYWAHTIVKDPTITQSRISMTFRNYLSSTEL